MRRSALVLLHGVGLDHSMWAPSLRFLGDDFTVVTPDLAGHGARPPAGPGITLADLAEGVAGDIPEGSHVVGFSLGALVAQYLALHRPELVASLVSVSSVCRRTPQERSAVLARLRSAESDFAASVEASLDRWYAGTQVPEGQVHRTAAVLRANDPLSFTACYRVFATGDAVVGPELGRISVPALAVTGADDPGSTPEMTRRLAAAIPGCRAEIVGGARHMLPVERPRELVHRLTTFLGEVAHA